MVGRQILMPWRKHILISLISALEIIINIDVIADLEEDDRSSNNERCRQENPVADELRLKRHTASVEVPCNGSSSGLNALVEPDIICRAATRVGESADEPKP